MADYTNGQVAVLQKFVDLYRGAPEIFSIGTGFVGCFGLREEESADLGALVLRGDVEHRRTPTEPIGEQDFYRLSDRVYEGIGKLRAEGRIVFR